MLHTTKKSEVKACYKMLRSLYPLLTATVAYSNAKDMATFNNSYFN